MKKIIIALSIAGFTWFSAAAQTTPLISCAAPKANVCHRSGKGVSCYNTPYAQDYNVCKGDYGYFISCETPEYKNSTHPPIPVAEAFASNEYLGYMDESVVLRSSTEDNTYANTVKAAS